MAKIKKEKLNAIPHYNDFKKQQEEKDEAAKSAAHALPEKHKTGVPAIADAPASAYGGMFDVDPKTYAAAESLSKEMAAGNGNHFGKTVYKGVTGINESVLSTLAALEKPIQMIFPGAATPFADIAKKYEDIDARAEAELEKSKENLSPAGKLLTDVGVGVVGAIPSAAAAVATGGASLAPQAAITASRGAGLANTVRDAMTRAGKNPMYWMSGAQTFGNDYEAAKENGANEAEAYATAIISTGLNAGVEVAGGLEVLPKMLKSGGAKAIYQWVKSMLDEGKEEVVQGVITNITQKGIYDPQKEWYSTEDQDAVINPNRMAQEFGMGAAIGGLLGGGQIGAIAASNAAARNAAQKDAVQQLAEEMARESMQNATQSAPAQMQATENAQMPAENKMAQRAIQAAKAASVEDAASQFGKAGAQAYKAGYRDTGDDAQYFGDFYKAYQAGMRGETAPKGSLTDTETAAAHAAGVSDAKRSAQAVYFGKDSQLVRDDKWKRAHLSTKDSRKLDALAKVLGVKIRFVDSVDETVQNELGDTEIHKSVANAQYGNGEILLALDAENPVMVSVVHEAVHRLRETTPAEYASLVQFVQNNMSGGALNWAINRRGEDYKGADRTELTEEVVADAFGQLINDTALLDQFVKDNRTAAEKLLDYIRDMINDIKRALNKQNLQLTAEQRKEFQELHDNLYEAEKLLGNALNMSAENVSGKEAQKNTTEDGGVQFSLKNKNLTINSRIPFTTLDGYINVAKGDSAALGRLDNAVNGIKKGTYENDATGYRANITAETISKAMYPTPVKFNRYEENYIRNLNAMLMLPELFKRAVYVDSKPPQKAKNQNTQIKEYHHFVAPVLIGTDTYRALITAREKKNSNTLYVLKVEVLPMKKKAHPLAAQQKTVVSQFRGVPSNISIPELVDGVKIFNYDTGKTDVYSGKDIKFSLKDSDYMAAVKRGDMETAQKMVDEVAKEAGYSVKAYHGTDNEFNTFGRNRIKSNTGVSFYGNGFYFSTSKSDASNYGNIVKPVYLRAEKVLDIDSDTWTYELGLEDKKEAIHVEKTSIEQARNGFLNVHYTTKDNPQKWESFSHVSPAQLMGDETGKKFVERKLNPSSSILPRDVKNLEDLAKQKGFDAIKGAGSNVGDLGTEYVVFSGSQIKSADPVTYDDNGNVIPLSERFNSEKNDIRYSRKGMSIEEYIEKYGPIPAGEKPYREVSVPKKTGEKEKVSQTVRTVLEAEATPDEMVPTIEELVAEGEFSYESYSDRGAMAGATRTIKSKGFETALADWLSEVKQGKVSKRSTALGWALYNNCANSGDTKSAMTVLTAMVEHQRSAAQALQATRILKKMSPAGQLYGVQRSISNLQSELREKFGDKAPNLTISKYLADKFMDAKTQKERDEIMTEIYKDIGRQMPNSFMDKWRAWRYLAMLGNPRTHVRNIVGNLGFAPVVWTKDLVATGIEAVAGKASGGKMGRTKALPSAELISAAAADFPNAQKKILEGGKYNESEINDAIEEGRVIFKTRVLEKARVGNRKLMEQEDLWFSKGHYAIALAQYCQANSISAQHIRSGQLSDHARAYAIKEAQKATYRDTNAFSEFVSNMGRYHGNNPVGKAGSLLIEGVLPFRKTPANILVRGLEYSPAGFLKGLTWDLWMVRKHAKNPDKGITAAEAIDHISAGFVGTQLVALGAFGAMMGVLRGNGGDDEDQKKFDELQGHQAYSLELEAIDTSVTLDWLAPEVLPLFIGVNIAEEAMRSKEDLTMSDLMAAIGNVTAPMLTMSCLSGLNELFESVSYATNEGIAALPKIAMSAATSLITQAIPTLAGQIERTVQENGRMTTYTDKNNRWLTPDMQYSIGRASSRTLGWDFNQIPYIDAWGRQEVDTNRWARGLNNFLNPAYVSKIEGGAMEEELQRLYDATGEAKVLPDRAAKYFTVNEKRKDLTAQEYVKYATAKGQKSYELVSKLTANNSWKSLSDAEKVEAIAKAYEYANAVAKTKVSAYKLEGANAKIRNSENDTLYIMAWAAQTDVDNGLKRDGETISNSKSLLQMEAMYALPSIANMDANKRKELFLSIGVGKTVAGYSKDTVKSELSKMRETAD